MKNSATKLLFNKIYTANEESFKKLNPRLNPDLYKVSDKYTTQNTKVTIINKVLPGVVSSGTVDIPITNLTKSLNSNSVKAINHSSAPTTRSWQELISQINSCVACKLCENRVNAVIEDGSRQAKWLFVGEDAGDLENSSGRPFRGKQGELLAKMLVAMRLDINKDVYLTNVVKCVSALNKHPSQEDTNSCKGFLFNQISLVKPDIIVALGKLASHALLLSQLPLNKLRLSKLDFNGTPVVVSYSLASLLRNEHLKRDAWLDLQFAMQRINE